MGLVQALWIWRGQNGLQCLSLFYSILYVTYDSQYHLAVVSIISCMDLHILYLWNPMLLVKWPCHDAQRHLKAAWTISLPWFPHIPCSWNSPTLAPDSTTQMSYDFDDTPEFRSILSELVGALSNPAANGNSGSPHNNTTSKYSNWLSLWRTLVLVIPIIWSSSTVCNLTLCLSLVSNPTLSHESTIKQTQKAEHGFC